MILSAALGDGSIFSLELHKKLVFAQVGPVFAKGYLLELDFFFPLWHSAIGSAST
jgi:hypothetical protein